MECLVMRINLTIFYQTRIVVERSFGSVKGQWRILKRTLNMKTPQSCGRTIVSCMVLHDLTVDAADDTDLDDRIDENRGWNRPAPVPVAVQPVERYEKRNNIKCYLNFQ